jgi:tetratricopeptide (TPR) repeat protein
MKKALLNKDSLFQCGKLFLWTICLFLLPVFLNFQTVNAQVLPAIEAMIAEADGYRNSEPQRAHTLAKAALAEAIRLKNEPTMAMVYRFIGVLNFMTGDLELAAIQFDSAYYLYNKLGDEKGIAASLNNRGVIYQEQSNYTKALECFNESVALKFKFGDSAGATSGLLNAATILSYTGDNLNAIKAFEEVIRIAAISKDTSRIIDANINLSTVWINERKPQKALILLREAMTLSNITGDDYSLAYCYNNIGGVYQNTFENDKAISYFNMALALRDDLGDLAGVASTLDNLGKMYLRLNRLDNALDYFFQALQYNQQLGDQRSIAINMNSIGELLIKKGDYPAAIEYFNQAIELAGELNLRQEARVTYANMIMSYAALHQFDSVQVYFAHYNSTADSSWYLKINPAKVKPLDEEGAIPESASTMRFYFIYGLILLAIAAAGWIASRYWYRK